MAALHPQIVHFAVALLVIGVLFRIVSLIGRPAFVAPAALTLLVLGTAAMLLAVSSGTAAHGPVERVPGSRTAVMVHEMWADRTRDVFLGLMVVELVGLLLLRSPKQRTAYAVSAVVGLAGVFCLYQTGEAGGRLVYEYAGGIGIRSGDPAAVDRLLLAGLYQQGLVERKAGRPADAAALFAQAATRFRSDQEVQLVGAESLLIDRKDAAAALAALRAITPARENRTLRIRHGMLTADALEAAGQRDGAMAVIQALASEFPDVARLKQRLETLQTPPAPK